MSGWCVYGDRCVIFDDAHRVAGFAERGDVCEACRDALARDVAALPADYVDLEQLIPVGSSSGAGRVAGTAEAAVPIRLDVEALQREIRYECVRVEVAVRLAADLSRRSSAAMRDGRAVVLAVTVIASHVDVLLSKPIGRDALDGLRSLHVRARRKCGAGRSVTRLPGDCSGCGASSLCRDDGSETVRCAGCGRRWTWDDYRRYVGLELAQRATAPPL